MASRGHGIMHRKLLFEIPYLSLVLFQEHLWVLVLINNSIVLNLHHSGSKSQCRDSFFEIMLFWPDVSDHDSLAVTSNSILKQIGQLTLSVWNVILLVVTGRYHYLL